MMDAMSNETELMDVMTQVTGAQDTIDSVTATVIAAETSLMTVENKVIATGTTISENTDALTDLQALVETQMI